MELEKDSTKCLDNRQTLKIKSILMVLIILLAFYPVNIVSAAQNPAIVSCYYLYPDDEREPGESIYIKYNIENPNSDSITAWLGATIRSKSTGTEYNDEANDLVVTLEPGSYSYYRYFEIPIDAEVGTYDVVCGLHGGNIIGEGSDWGLQTISDVLKVTTNLPSFNGVYTYPFEPSQEDKAAILAEIVSSTPLSEVKTFWSVDQINWNEIPMFLWYDGASSDTYRTNENIPEQSPETTVYYKVSATNTGGTKVSSVGQYTVESTVARIHGRITDDSGNGIYGATVTLESPIYGVQATTSDNTAAFTFHNIEAGVYTLRVNMDGYSLFTRSVTITTGPNEIDVHLTTLPPASLTVSILAPYNIFSAQQYRPITVKAKVTDNLENIVVGNSGSLVKATFSNGDSELVLLDDGLHNDEAANDGIYANQWVPSGIPEGYDETDCTITIEASSGTLSSNPITVSGVIRNGTVVDVVHSYMEIRTFKSVMTTDTDVLYSPAWNSYIENVLTDAGPDKSAYSSASLDRSSGSYYIKYNTHIYIPIKISIFETLPPTVVYGFIDISQGSLVTDEQEYKNVKTMEILANSARIDVEDAEYYDETYNSFAQSLQNAQDMQNGAVDFGHGFTTLQVASDVVAISATGGLLGTAGTSTIGTTATTGLTTLSNLVTIGKDSILIDQGIATETANIELFDSLGEIDFGYLELISDTYGDVENAATLKDMYVGYLTLRDLRAAFGNQWVQNALTYSTNPGFLTQAAATAHKNLYENTDFVGVVDSILGALSVDKADQALTCYLFSLDQANIYQIDSQLMDYQLKIKDGSINELELKNYYELYILKNIIYSHAYKSVADQAEKNMWGEISNFKYPNLIYQGVDSVGYFITGKNTEEAIQNLNEASQQHRDFADSILKSTFEHWIIHDHFMSFSNWLTNAEKSDAIPPIPNAGLDLVVNLGEKVNFDGSDSSDNVGVISYSWDFDSSDDVQEDANGIFPSHIYDEPGTYIVTLTVNDGKNNGPVSDTLTVYVEPEDFSVEILPKTASFSIESGSSFTQQFNFKNVGTVADTFRISTERGTLSAEEMTLNPGEVGIFTLEDTITIGGLYPVSVAVWPKSDPAKAAVSKLTIDVLSHSPYTPSIPSGPTIGSSTKSYAYTTNTNDPDKNNLKYIFDWGDGSTTESRYYASGVSVSLEHQWQNDGLYYVKAKAIDSTGKESEWSNGKAVLITTPTYDASKPVVYWEKSFTGSGTNKINSVIETSDGGCLLAGFTESLGAGQKDGWIIKTDTYGNELWNKTFGDSWNDEFNEIHQTSDGGFIVAGSKSSSSGLYDVWLVKLNSNCVEQWSKTYGGIQEDEGMSVIETPDGCFIVAGRSDSYGTGNSCGWIIKTTKEGEKIWSREYGSSNYDTFENIQPAADGGYILVGHTKETGTADVWLVKVDYNGLWQWGKTYGSGGFDEANSVKTCLDGGYIIAAEYDYVDDVSSTYLSQAWVIKTDENGNQLWDIRSFWDNENSFARDVLIAPDGDYLMLGDKKDEGFLSKIDASGQIEWSQKLGNGSRLQSIALNSNGDYLLAGYRGVNGFLLKAGQSRPIIPYVESPLSGHTYSINPVNLSGNIFGVYGDVDLSYQLDKGPVLPLESPNFSTVLPYLPNGNHTVLIYAEDMADKVYSKKIPFSFESELLNEWSFTYGGQERDRIYASQQTLDGGFILAGSYFDRGLVLKIDSSGREEWNKTFSDRDDFTCVEQTSDGGYVLTDLSSWLLKIDSSGNQQWVENCGEFDNGDLFICNSVKQTSDGGYVIVGHRSYSNRPDSDVCLVKANSSGVIEWSSSFGANDEDDDGYDVCETSDGGYVVLGRIVAGGYGSKKAYDVYVVKTDSSGNQIWVKQHGLMDSDRGYSIMETENGDLAVVGATKPYEYNPDNLYAFLLKLDSFGNKQFSATYGGDKSECFYYLDQTSDEGFILAGTTSSYGNGGNDAYIVKTDYGGNIEWERTKGGIGDEYAHSIHECENGYFVLAGYTNSYGEGSDDCWVLKSDLAPPHTLIRSPLQDKIYSQSNVELNTTTDELSDIWYSLDGSTNSSSVNDTTLLNTTLENLDNGMHSLTVYAQDSNMNLKTSTVSFKVDFIPQLSVNSPIEGTTYFSRDVLLSISSNEIATIQYKVDNGSLYSTENAKSLDLFMKNLTDGSHQVQILAEDGSGNIFSSKVNFSVNAESSIGTNPQSSTVIGVDDGFIVETPRIKYHLANGGFAKELWIDTTGDGVYDEDIGFDDSKYAYYGFGSWISIYSQVAGNEVYEGSALNGNYSCEIIDVSSEKVVIEFTNNFDYVTAKTQWTIFSNGDAKVTPWTLEPMEYTTTLGFSWWINPHHQGDIVGMRLSEDVEENLNTAYDINNIRQIASPGPAGKGVLVRPYSEFSDISYSHPYQFYQDNTHDYTCLIVEPKAETEEDWEWIENDQANDGIWGGRLNYNYKQPASYVYKAAGLVEWVWYSDDTHESGATGNPLDTPTTQPINQDQMFSFYVHWMWEDTTEQSRHETAGQIAQMLADQKIVKDINILTSAQENESSPVWTPDGSNILYTFERISWNDQDSYRMNESGNEKERINVGEGQLVSFSDVNQIGSNLLLTKSSGASDLYKANIVSGELVPLATDPERSESDGYWSPTNNKIVYTQDSQLWIMDTDGNNRKRLGTSVDVGAGKDWMPGSDLIVYSAKNEMNNYDLWLIKSDGSSQIQLTDSSANEWWPSFSPDGRYLVFVSDEDGMSDLWVRNIDGDYKVRLTYNLNLQQACSPHWSPDGSKIAFVSQQNNNNDIILLQHNLKMDIDINAPVLTISSPLNDKLYNSKFVELDAKVSKLAEIWYELDGVSSNHVTGQSLKEVLEIPDGNHVLTVYIEDMYGNSNNSSVNFTVDTLAPVITINSPSKVNVYNTSTVGLNVSTNEASTIWYSLNGGLNSTPIEGISLQEMLSGLYDNEYSLTVYAKDAAGNTGSSSVNFIVDTAPPVITINSPLADQSYYDIVDLNISINEPSDIWYSIDDGENSTIVNGNSLHASLSGLAEGEHQVNFYARDNAHNIAYVSVSFTVSDVDRPPELNPIGDKSVNENELLEFNISAIDVDGDAIIYSATGLPAGATFDATAATFIWTPGSGDAGNYNVEFIANANGQTDSEAIVITVSDVDQPPVLDPIGNKAVDENVLLSFIINATDADGDAITYSAIGLPTGANFDTTAATFIWTPGSGDAGNYNVEFIATANSKSDSETITITVGEFDQLPKLSFIGDKSVNENELLEFNISATDADGDAVTYSAKDLPDGANFDVTTATFSWTPGSGDAGNYSVEFIATANGLNDSETIVIIVGAVNDWNPWNDTDSDGGEAVTLSELQDAIYDWRFGIQTSTGEMVDLSRLQDLIYQWRFGY